MEQTLNQSEESVTANRSARRADYSGFGYFVYVVTDNKRIYVGQTNNLKRRFNDHNNKQVKSTKRFLIHKMFIVEKLKDRSIAFKREKFYKSYVGRKKIRELLKKKELKEYRGVV